MDISQAFWQVPLKGESRKYTGFIINNQSYVFTKMPFELKTGEAAFTRALDLTLRKEAQDFVIVYIDDILIASNSVAEHFEHIVEQTGGGWVYIEPG